MIRQHSAPAAPASPCCFAYRPVAAANNTVRHLDTLSFCTLLVSHSSYDHNRIDLKVSLKR